MMIEAADGILLIGCLRMPNVWETHALRHCSVHWAMPHVCLSVLREGEPKLKGGPAASRNQV